MSPTAGTQHPIATTEGGGCGSSGRKKGKQCGDDITHFFQKKDKHQLTSAEDMAIERANRATTEAEKKVNSDTKGKAITKKGKY